MDQPTRLPLEKRTGVPACCSLQPLRKCVPIDAQAGEEHESSCGNRAAPLPRHHARRATATAALHVLGDEAVVAQPASDIPRAQQPQVKEFCDGSCRTSNPHRDLGCTSLPWAPSGMANGRRPAAHGHSLADRHRLFPSATSTRRNRPPPVVTSPPWSRVQWDGRGLAQLRPVREQQDRRSTAKR
ncbi:hypothetical protein MRX96_042158 [Rhipicephalus microplus]